MESVTRFIVERLTLKVNREKSAVARPPERKFLGFSFTWAWKPKRRIAPKAKVRMKQGVLPAQGLGDQSMKGQWCELVDL